MSRRALLLVPVVLVAAGCNTVLSEDRAVPGDTITVSTASGPPTGPNQDSCPPGSDVEVFVDGDLVLDGVVADELGMFTADLEVPEEAVPDTYAIHAECTPQPSEGNPEPATVVLNPAELIVEPVLAMEADPATLAPGEAFEVTGNFCISDTGSAVPPEADITFEGETQTATATDPQPFEETWTLELEAPAEPGTYEITGICTFEELPGITLPPPDLQLPDEFTAAAIEPSEGGTVGEREYPVIEVVVAQPTTTTAPTTTTSQAPAVAPRAVSAQPTYTG